MLNRRHLRIKVMQALYATFQSAKNDTAGGEKEVFQSIDKIYELYLNLFLLIIEIADYAERMLEDRKQKYLPSEEDLNPNPRFIDNRIISQIRNGDTDRLLNKTGRIPWHEELGLVKKLYRALADHPKYQQYLHLEESSFERDKAMMLSLVSSVIAPSEDVMQVFGEHSIFWVDDFDFTCAMVMRTIEGQKEDDRKIRFLDLYKDAKEDSQFARMLFRKTIENDGKYSAFIFEKTKNWEPDRIAMMDMILMKMAVCEILEFPTIPVKVTLNEYIDISKYYSTPKSRLFVNGILDKLLFDFKDKELFKKSGRGLVE